MITSPAPGYILDKLRRLSGPNPEGSKLTDVERLHLVFMLGALMEGMPGCAQAWTAQSIVTPLIERGLAEEDLAKILDGVMAAHGDDVVEFVDLIAVHPRLKHPYLD